MGENYRQLSLEERIEIARRREAGWSWRRIGVAIGRSHTTVSREVSRNSRATKVWKGGYSPARAQELALRRRRWDCRFKLVRLLSLSKGGPAGPREARPCDGTFA
jgi:IS30 family transposase